MTTTTTAAPQGGYNKGQFVQVTLNRATRLRSRLATEIEMIESRIATANTTPDGQDRDDVASLLESRSVMTQALAELDTTISLGYAGNQGEGFKLLFATARACNDHNFYAQVPTPVGTFSRGGNTRTYAASLTRQQASRSELSSFAEEEAVADQLLQYEMRTNVQVDSRILAGDWYGQPPAKGQ